MKSISSSLVLGMLLIFAAALISCQNSGSDAAKDEARADIENTDGAAVTTSDNSATPNAAEEVPTGPLTSIEFADNKHDYGLIEQGEKVAHVFKFKNTGNEPLVLSNVKPSCGCTTPSWTKEPIAPGGEGEIQVEFDSKGKLGKQTKTVTVTANTDPAKTILTITGEIVKEEEPS